MWVNNAKITYHIPYSGKFSLGSYFRDFADCIRGRENKNRNNLFQQKFILSILISIYRVSSSSASCYIGQVCLFNSVTQAMSSA